MDKLKISSKLLTGVISKIAESKIKEKTGYRTNICINDIDVGNDGNGLIKLHLDVDASISIEEFKKFVRIMENGGVS